MGVGVKCIQARFVNFHGRQIFSGLIITQARDISELWSEWKHVYWAVFGSNAWLRQLCSYVRVPLLHFSAEKFGHGLLLFLFALFDRGFDIGQSFDDGAVCWFQLQCLLEHLLCLVFVFGK